MLADRSFAILKAETDLGRSTPIEVTRIGPSLSSTSMVVETGLIPFAGGVPVEAKKTNIVNTLATKAEVIPNIESAPEETTTTEEVGNPRHLENMDQNTTMALIG